MPYAPGNVPTQCALLEDELTATQKRLTEARRNIAGLVQMCDLLATGKTATEAELKKAAEDVSRLNLENSQLDRRINSMMTVAQQRDHLFRENQRLTLELSMLRGATALM